MKQFGRIVEQLLRLRYDNKRTPKLRFDASDDLAVIGTGKFNFESDFDTKPRLRAAVRSRTGSYSSAARNCNEITRMKYRSNKVFIAN